MIEFEGDCLNAVDGKALVPGRVHQGTVRLGTIFTAVADPGLSGSRRGVYLRVEGIVAYGHSLDELPSGMTGQLSLSGDASGLVDVPYPVLLIGDG